jgi:hypothetical protein
MKKTSTIKKKPVKSVGSAMNMLMGHAASAAKSECSKPKKKVPKKPAVTVNVTYSSELGPKEYSPLIELLENKMQNSKSKFKFVYLNQVPYKTYVTVKRIDASVKIRPMTEYFIGLVSGKTIIVGTTEIPDRRTGKVEYAVKLPVALRTKSLSVRLYYADGCNVFVDYNRTYTFEKMKTFKNGETFKFEIDLHLDDTNPKR